MNPNPARQPPSATPPAPTLPSSPLSLPRHTRACRGYLDVNSTQRRTPPPSVIPAPFSTPSYPPPFSTPSYPRLPRSLPRLERGYLDVNSTNAAPHSPFPRLLAAISTNAPYDPLSSFPPPFSPSFPPPSGNRPEPPQTPHTPRRPRLTLRRPRLDLGPKPNPARSASAPTLLPNPRAQTITRRRTAPRVPIPPRTSRRDTVAPPQQHTGPANAQPRPPRRSDTPNKPDHAQPPPTR